MSKPLWKRPVSILLATTLLGGLYEATAGHNIRWINRISPIHRLSQFKNIHPSRLWHSEPAKVMAKAPPKPYVHVPGHPSVSDPPFAEELKAHCHGNASAEAEAGPNTILATRYMTDWENCNRLDTINDGLHGKLSPAEIKQKADKALQDIHPDLDVDKANKVMPLFDHQRGARGLTIDDRVPDPQVAIPARDGFGKPIDRKPLITEPRGDAKTSAPPATPPQF